MSLELALPEFMLGTVAALNSLIFFAVVAIHFIFAFAVYADAEQHGARLVHPILWAVVVLLGGVIAAACYWVICRLPMGDASYHTVSGDASAGQNPVQDKVEQYRKELELKRRASNLKNRS